MWCLIDIISTFDFSNHNINCLFYIIFILVCGYSIPFTFGVVAFFLFFAIWGSKMAWESRNLPMFFNESKQIGIAVYFVLLVSFIVLPLDLILSQWGSTSLQTQDESPTSPLSLSNKQESIHAAVLLAMANNRNLFSDWNLDELDESMNLVYSNVSNALSVLRRESGIFAQQFEVVETDTVPNARAIALLRGTCILIIVCVEVIALFASRFYTDLVKKEGRSIAIASINVLDSKGEKKSQAISSEYGSRLSTAKNSRHKNVGIVGKVIR